MIPPRHPAMLCFTVRAIFANRRGVPRNPRIPPPVPGIPCATRRFHRERRMWRFGPRGVQTRHRGFGRVTRRSQAGHHDFAGQPAGPGPGAAGFVMESMGAAGGVAALVPGEPTHPPGAVDLEPGAAGGFAAGPDAAANVGAPTFLLGSVTAQLSQSGMSVRRDDPVRDHEPAGTTAAGSSQRLWNVAGS